MKNVFLMGVLLAVMMVWSSCWRKATCDCTKGIGCSTLLAIQTSDDSVIAKGMACADSSVKVDSSLI